MTQESAEKQRARVRDSQIFGALLTLGGFGWILNQLNIADISIPVVLAGMLIVLGVAMILARKTGRRFGLTILGVLLVFILGAFSDSLHPSPKRLAAHVTYVPHGGTNEYSIGGGTIVIDLTKISVDKAPTLVKARVGIGDLHVHANNGVDFEIVSEVSAGQIYIEGTNPVSGAAIGKTFSSTRQLGNPKVRLELTVGIGKIRVARSF